MKLIHILRLFSSFMMPGSKGLSPHELAHKWVKDLGTRPDMSIKVGCISHDMRIWGRVLRASDARLAPTETECRCGSAQHGTIRRHHGWGLLTPTSFNHIIYKRQEEKVVS